MIGRRYGGLLAVLVTLVMTGCVQTTTTRTSSVAPRENPAATIAEDHIENSVADDYGLGPLDATCDTQFLVRRGATFTCEGELRGGRTIEFDALITEEDTVRVTPTNLVDSDLLETAVRTDYFGGESSAAEVSCGSGLVVIVRSKIQCDVDDDGESLRVRVHLTEDLFIESVEAL